MLHYIAAMCCSHEQSSSRKPTECDDRMPSCAFCCINTSTLRQVLLKSSTFSKSLEYTAAHVTSTVFANWQHYLYGCLRSMIASNLLIVAGRYQVVTSWMGDCLQTGKPSSYIINTKVQLSFPSLWG